MPSKSKSQYKIMGMAYSYKKGDMSKKDFKNDALFNKIKKIADGMTLQQLKDFVNTPPSPKDLPNKVKKENLILPLKSIIKEEIIKYLYENISIKNNLDSIEMLFLHNKIKEKDKIKKIIDILKSYVSIKNTEKTNNGFKINFNDNLSTTEFITFVTEIKNKLSLNIKRENKNVYIIGLE